MPWLFHLRWYCGLHRHPLNILYFDYYNPTHCRLFATHPQHCCLHPESCNLYYLSPQLVRSGPPQNPYPFFRVCYLTYSAQFRLSKYNHMLQSFHRTHKNHIRQNQPHLLYYARFRQNLSVRHFHLCCSISDRCSVPFPKMCYHF